MHHRLAATVHVCGEPRHREQDTTMARFIAGVALNTEGEPHGVLHLPGRGFYLNGKRRYGMAQQGVGVQRMFREWR